MDKGFIKAYRKLQDSDVWEKNPLYLKVWLWLLFNADYRDGTLTCTLDHISDRVAWREGRAPKSPSRKVISDVLNWLESEKMIVKKQAGRGNRKYTSVSIVNYGSYNVAEARAVTVEKQKSYTLKEVKRSKEVDSNESTAQAALELDDAAIIAKRDDYIDGMCKFWEIIAPKLKVPHSLFARWRKQFGVDVPLDIAQQVANSGKKLKSPQAYISKACSSEFQRRKQQRIEQPTDEDFASLDAWLEDDPQPL